MRTKSKFRINKKLSEIITVSIDIVLLLSCIYGFYVVNIETGIYRSPIFWIGSILELVLLGLVFRVKDKWRFLIWIISIPLPMFLGLAIKEMKPLGMVCLVFVIPVMLIIIIKTFRPEIKILQPQNEENLSQNGASFNMSLPKYLPAGYSESARNVSGRKPYKVVEIIYEKEETENIIWLKESEGPLAHLRRNKTTNEYNLRIRGTQISIAEGKKKNQQSNVPSFIDAHWNFKSWNYNLRADKLPLAEVEKIISSILQ